MSKVQQAETEITRLPKEFVDRLTRPFARFLSIQAGGGVILLLFTVAALVLSNSPWAHYFESVWETSVGLQLGSFEFARSLREWINDGLMAVFFLLVGLEIKRELVLGELRDPKAASLPVIAALGGMMAPALVYLLFVLPQGGEATGGWAIPMATDIAFSVGVLALLGRMVPASIKLFLLALAIVDDLVELREAISEFESEAVDLRGALQESGELMHGYTVPYATWDELGEGLGEHRLLSLGYQEGVKNFLRHYQSSFS